MLALVGAVLLVFGMLRPGVPSQTSEAAFLSPGGISALPSFFPGLPGIVDQVVPAIIPASAPGNQALISVWAEPVAVVFPDTGAIFDSNCNINAAGVWDGLGSVCFKVQANDLATGALRAHRRYVSPPAEATVFSATRRPSATLRRIMGDGTHVGDAERRRQGRDADGHGHRRVRKHPDR